jgi:addiction module RelE/StbE family toxin
MPGPTRLIWLPEAVTDIQRLHQFIQRHNPAAARRAVERIKKAAARLQEHPASGKPVSKLTDFRDLLIPFGNGNYVLRYRLVGPLVVIVRVWHSREDRDKD